MNRLFVYSLLIVVVAGCCLFEYGGARLFSSLSIYRQNRTAIVALGFCALAAAVVRNNIVVTNCLVLVGALVAGTLLCRQLGSVGALSTMLVVAAIVDLISARAGPSRWLVDLAQHAHGEPVLQFLVISLKLKGAFVPVIGIGDLMFFTAVVSVLRRLRWSETSSFVVPLAGILSALGVGLFTGFTPALPFLAGAVLFYAYALNSRGHQPCQS